jgi:outer membrane receptor protein involved in Fe transport
MMNSRFYRNISTRTSLTIGLLTLATGVAFADGRIVFQVVDATTKQSIPNAEIILEPGEKEIDDVRYETDVTGKVTTELTSSGERKFRVRFARFGGVSYKPFSASVTVVDDQDIEVIIPLDPGEIGKDINEKLRKLDARNTSQYTFRDRKFFELFPLAIGNRYDISRTIQSAPGMVRDSLFQTHARGAQNGVSYVLDGFIVPSGALGALQPTLPGNLIETMQVRTGGHGASQFGGEGAVADIQLRPARYPSANAQASSSEFTLGSGDKKTTDFSVGSGRQWVARRTGKSLGTYIAYSQYKTDNGVETPSNSLLYPAKNRQFFGKFDQQLSKTTTLAAVTTYQEATADTLSNAAQHNQQKDQNQISFVQFKTRRSPASNTNISLGFTRSYQDLQATGKSTAFAFNPDSTVQSDAYQIQVDTQNKPVGGTHDFRYGLFYQEATGLEQYSFNPQSNAVAAGLVNIDPRFGKYFTGLTTSSKVFPYLTARRTNITTSAYLQDTWQMQGNLFVNYGARFDSYDQQHQINVDDTAVTGNPDDEEIYQTTASKVLPRVNFSYVLSGDKAPTILRFGYNQLQTLAGVEQGNFSTNPQAPQLTDQNDVSIERQLSNQKIKFGYYSKKNTNQIGYRSLLPFSATGNQTLAYSTVNLGKGESKGTEFSYEYNPRPEGLATSRLTANSGVSAYLVYGTNDTKVTQGTTISTPLQEQKTTLNMGLGYRNTQGTQLSVGLYQGSGLRGSGIGNRDKVSEMNLRLATPISSASSKAPLQLEIGVENLLNKRALFNYADGTTLLSNNFAGNRLQLGRRVMVSLSQRF